MTCPECQGSGRVQAPFLFFFTKQRPCSNCHGYGYRDDPHLDPQRARRIRPPSPWPLPHIASDLPPETPRVTRMEPPDPARPKPFDAPRSSHGPTPAQTTASERDDDTLSRLLLVGEPDHVAAIERAREWNDDQAGSGDDTNDADSGDD